MAMGRNGASRWVSLAGLMSMAALAACGSEHDAPVAAEFVGTSPAGEAITRRLGIPRAGATESLHWRLTLFGDAASGTGAYRLRITPDPAVPGSAGPQAPGERIREGAWRVSVGPSGVRVHDLAGALSLAEIGEDLLHVLGEGGDLLPGNGGWSYTLNRSDATEAPGDTRRAMTLDPPSYTLVPLATGAAVRGVFEGRTPCLGISRALGLPADPGCIKAKWRLTLFQDPQTTAPTTYLIEGSLHARQAREGRWTIERGTPSRPEAVVYQLHPAGGEAGLLLLEGDRDVLFFLDADRRPMVGHAEFSYTLNRRE
jgi:hypothetical protein